jgi:valyl-tRNA synthetase
MSSLPKAFDPKSAEQKWRSLWEKNNLFRANPSSPKPPFSIVIPPPNVTGVLHMGHALVDTLQDILIRWKRMEGFEALWVPGTDHAGIATQTVVEKHLRAKTGKRRSDFAREEFLTHIWQWVEVSRDTILEQLKRLGCSADWSRLRFTMDEPCSKAVRTVFKKMFDEGLIYQGDYLVNWDSLSGTALSDDEVEYEEVDGFLYHIRYPLEEGKGSIEIATTRPETMLADVAVAVHPEDERYRPLIGKKVSLPLSDRTLPLIADPFVDPAFGTGAVKITPAHDPNDYEVGIRHNLERINMMTPDGRVAFGPFKGLPMQEARAQIVEALKKGGFLVRIVPHKQRLGFSYRSKALIEPYLSKQWFIRMGPFKEKLLSAVSEKRVKLIPPHFESTYNHWIENLRDWCISRQIWWGHRIPVWHHKHDPSRKICYAGEGEPAEVARDRENWVQDPDVLDTWFSSALWPFSVFGWPDQTEDLAKFYPTSTLVTGHDILFFWVARMILMGEYAAGKIPFQETFLHGLIYGKSYFRQEGGYLSSSEKKPYDLGAPLPPDILSKWEKMSKSKGNVIDPIEVIDEYGADAMRIALASSVTFARQIDLDQRRFEEFKNFANKVWNGSRFVLMHLEEKDPGPYAPGLEDRWVLSLLNRVIKEVTDSLTAYAFDKAATRAYEFFWNDFCSTYLELAKPALFGKVPGKATKQTILRTVLSSAIRLLHPFAPFITEEIYSLIRTEEDPLFCSVAPYPTPLGAPDPAVEAEFAHLLEYVHAVRNIRGQMQIPPSEKTECFLIDSPLSDETARLLLSLTPTSALHRKAPSPLPFGASASLRGASLFIPLPFSLVQKEKERLEKEIEKTEIQLRATEEKLQNSDFIAKAPPELVAKFRSQKEAQEATLELLRQKRSQFS